MDSFTGLWLAFRDRFKADYIIPNDIDDLNDHTIECIWRGWLAAKQDAAGNKNGEVNSNV